MFSDYSWLYFQSLGVDEFKLDIFLESRLKVDVGKFSSQETQFQFYLCCCYVLSASLYLILLLKM